MFTLAGWESMATARADGAKTQCRTLHLADPFAADTECTHDSVEADACSDLRHNAASQMGSLIEVVRTQKGP
jgi:hypothetical protein